MRTATTIEASGGDGWQSQADFVCEAEKLGLDLCLVAEAWGFRCAVGARQLRGTDQSHPAGLRHHTGRDPDPHSDRAGGHHAVEPFGRPVRLSLDPRNSRTGDLGLN
jgi:hypothetical protein